MREEIRQVHLSHIISAAELASAEEPELAEKFRVPGRVKNYAAFRTAARGVLTEAESRKELLTKHGLSESVLVALRKSLDEFDVVAEQGAQGRAMHVGASAELANSAGEILRVVKVMDPSDNRIPGNMERYSIRSAGCIILVGPSGCRKVRGTSGGQMGERQCVGGRVSAEV
jgi:hypothetical protein